MPISKCIYGKKIPDIEMPGSPASLQKISSWINILIVEFRYLLNGYYFVLSKFSSLLFYGVIGL